MMLDQSKYSMKEHHHFDLLTIDYDRLDKISVPYSSPIFISGKWRVPVIKKNLSSTTCSTSVKRHDGSPAF